MIQGTKICILNKVTFDEEGHRILDIRVVNSLLFHDARNCTSDAMSTSYVGKKCNYKKKVSEVTMIFCRY